MAEPEHNGAGAVESLRRLVTGAAGMVRNRVELFGVELEEEHRRLVELLMLTGAAMILGFLAACLLTLIVLLLFPPPCRIFAAAGLFVIYGGVATGLVFRIRKWLLVPPFPETIAQTRKDCECLIPRP